MTDPTHAVAQGREPIRVLAQRARRSLAEASSFLRSNATQLTFDGRVGRKWDLFIDQPIESIETCAISCSLSALISAGEDRGSTLIKEAVNTLLPLQLGSGGWTSWMDSLDGPASPDPEEPLVVDTYFALTALDLVGLTGSESIANGVEWFRRAHDSAHSGWGFYPGADPQLLPTCMAIIAMSVGSGPDEPHLRDVVNRGVEWLLARQVDGGWPSLTGRPPSAVHTAWALRALAAAGFDHYSRPVVVGREWLLANLDDRASTIDHYVTPGRSSAGARRPSRAITHINFADGVILNGLLASGTNILDQRLLSLTGQLIEAQDREGFWRSLHSPRDQPVYALMDACLALRAFADLVQQHESVLEITERIQQDEFALEATSRLAAAIQEQLIELTARLQELQTQNARILRELETQKDADRRLSSLEHGLVALRPVMALTRAVRNWPVLSLLVILQLAAYGLGALTIEPRYRVWSLVVGGLLTLTTGITYWAQTPTKRHPADPALRTKESTSGD